MGSDAHPLKVAREQRGLAKSQLARLVGLPGNGDKDAISQVIRWENGTRVPNRQRAHRLAKILGFDSAEEVRRLCREWRGTHQVPSEKPCVTL
jgi:transcriptional regulator with XRE-family HTH domain